MRQTESGSSDAPQTIAPQRQWGFLRRWLPWLAALILVAGALWQLGDPNGDLYQYRCFALAFWHGSARAAQAAHCSGRLPDGPFPPFTVLPLEYPPLALIPFLAPLLVGGEASVTTYVLAFNVLMLACLALTAWLIRRGELRHAGATGATDATTATGATTRYLLWLALGSTTIALVRFDALPALLTVMALLGARRRPALLPYILLALATLLKLYPALLIVFLALWDWRRSQNSHRDERGAGALILDRYIWVTGPTLAVGVALLIQGIADALTMQVGAPWLAVQGSRPPQIESTAAGLHWLWAVASGRGGAIHAVSVQRSLAFVEAPGTVLARLTLALALLAIGWAIWALFRSYLAPLRAMAGALLALLAGAAIFSPQYLLWASPLLALAYWEATTANRASAQRAPGRMSSHADTQAPYRRRWRLITLAWGGACILTTLIYSVGYLIALPAHSGAPLAIFMIGVIARNALVWYTAGALLWPDAAPRNPFNRGSAQRSRQGHAARSTPKLAADS